MQVFDLVKDKKYSDKKLLSQIIFYITKIDNIYISNETLTQSQISEIDQIYNKVELEDYPLQYITNSETFFGNEFWVDENVLIPRSETEYMVEKALRDMWSQFDWTKTISVYDLWTGSGAIWLSVAIWLTQAVLEADIYMLDVSDQALLIAKKNLWSLGGKISDDIYISLGYSDLLSEVKFDTENANIYILANLPYVDESDYDANINQLHREPKIALVAEDRGLALYYKLLDDILTREDLVDKKVNIYLEINDWQYDIIYQKYSDLFIFEIINTWHKNIYILKLFKETIDK